MSKKSPSIPHTLNEEQLALRDSLVRKYSDGLLRTKPVTKREARKAAEAVYKLAKFEVDPIVLKERVFIEPSPRAAWNLVCDLRWGNHPLNPKPGQTKLYEENIKRIQFPEIDGAIDGGFCAYCDFVESFGYETTGEYKLFKDTMGTLFVWPLDGACVVCDFPEEWNLDANNQLHNENGPAIRWRDGVSVWVIDGILLDEQIVVHPETQTVEQLVNERDADKQAIRINRFGWVPFLGAIGAEVVDEGRNDIEGTYEVLYRTDNFGQKLVATCITGKIVVMGVPDDAKSCEEVRQWLGGGRAMNIVGRT